MRFSRLSWVVSCALALVGGRAAEAGSARLVNIATRAAVGGPTGTPIPGFVLVGEPVTFSASANASLPLTSQWPLSGVNLVGAYPVVVRTSAGSVTSATANLVVATNVDWARGTNANQTQNDNGLASTNAAQMGLAAAQVGAFALPANSRDSALLVPLEPGTYPAQISGVGATAGVALVEIYELP